MLVKDRKECRGCQYMSSMSYGKMCNYILEVGHRRPKPVEECDEWKKKRRKKRC